MDLTQIFNFASKSSADNSAVVAALISGAFALAGVIFKSMRESKLKYITNERKAWRDNLREIMAHIYNTNDIDETKLLLTELYTRLNSYGYYNRKDILHDGHIWHLIKIMQITNSKSVMDKCKKKLRIYISLLLKFDWQRAKREVGNNVISILSVGLYIIACAFTVCPLYIKYGNSEIIRITFIGVGLLVIYILPSILVNINGANFGYLCYPIFLIVSIFMYMDFKVKFNDNGILISLICFSFALIVDFISCILNAEFENEYVKKVKEFQEKHTNQKVKAVKKQTHLCKAILHLLQN